MKRRMDSSSLSVRAGAESIYRDLRSTYLAQLVAPMDDMWAAFADRAAPHALLVGTDVAGCCAVDEERRLLRFYVDPRFQQHSRALLRLALKEASATSMMVFTLDPNYLSVALDLASERAAGVESHTLLFRSVLDPEVAMVESLTWAGARDHGRIVDFQAAALEAPRDFLEAYVRERLERRELALFEEGSRLLCVGELRRDLQQPGVAHLGLVVRESVRGRGIGSRMLASLVERARELQLRPHCSTEVSNGGARRAIERCGFRADHRVLRVSLAPP